MTGIEKLLDLMAKATPIALAGAALLGFFFREKIKHVLARSLSSEIETLKKDFAKELADHTANLQRDLEAYKVTLIAETERAKAIQDVKKTLALRMAERKFNALAGLLDTHMGFDTAVLAHVSTVLQGDPAIVQPAYVSNGGELLERFNQYTSAANAANAFLTLDGKAAALVVRQNAISLLSARMRHTDPAIPNSDPRAQQLMAAAFQLENLLRDQLQEMENLG